MDEKCIIVNDDGHGGFFNGSYASIEGLEKPIEQYPSDSSVLGEICNPGRPRWRDRRG